MNAGRSRLWDEGGGGNGGGRRGRNQTSQPIVSITVFHRNRKYLCEMLLNVRRPIEFTKWWFKVDFFSPALLYRRCQRSDEVAASPNIAKLLRET
ncbi:hypothetical protein ALC56_10898 [Trachymyrmex septentrionalis]|uniref:Uncharacterized protein n=1 Tax=Trachymyrmex septentrionalis TaxID=34720 RepID=A0A195F2X8_9HYME|nr:hypothetical protein ALC56_10898 [Trachymyrmex septentrionalis]